ncbi:MAG: hypothetical protein ACLFU3_06350 [Dichotomicrobium sp.]
MIHEQTPRSADAASFIFGFAEQMRTADINQFRNWYDRRCLLPGREGPAAEEGERGNERLAA